jgi:hypothetical protein
VVVSDALLTNTPSKQSASAAEPAVPEESDFRVMAITICGFNEGILGYTSNCRH